MRHLVAIIIIVFSSSCVFAQKLIYNVDLLTPSNKYAYVTVDVSDFHTSTLTYQMPAWAPGAYSMTNYGRFIKNFKALNSEGKELLVKRVNENRWEISSATDLKSIIYAVENSYKDSTSLYFALCHIDSNFFFANGTALFGYVNDRKDLPSTITYDTDIDWNIITPIGDSSEVVSYIAHPFHAKKRQLSAHAKNYDELADAPVMAGKDFQVRTFKQGGTTYEIAVASDATFEMDSLVDLTKKIAKSQTDFFGDSPFKRYVFLINAPTYQNLPVQNGFGALEHANSSAYLLANLPWSAFKEFGLGIISHELFHAWNVKRIHSTKLGPFDYTQRVMTTSLWLSEGITDYYAHTLLSRSGIVSPETFEKKIAEWMTGVNFSRYANSESLEQLSIDESAFDLEKAMTFYTKGPLVGLMLDIEIRSKTDNKKSLDDVMRALYADAKKGKHFKDEELIGKIEKISGVDLKSFHKRFIAGTDSLLPALGEYLPKMGLLKDYESIEQSGVSFRAQFREEGDAAIIDSFYSTDLQLAGIMVGDTILSLNSKPVSATDLDDFSFNNNAPQLVTVLVGRQGLRVNTSVVLTKPRRTKTVKKDVAPNPEATPMQAAIRKEIYGG